MEEKSHEKEKINNDNKNKYDNDKEEKYVYFMTPYEKSKEYNTYLSEEYNGNETLETIEEIYENKRNLCLKIKIYRFKIIPKSDVKIYKIPVIMEEENHTKHEYIIKLTNIKKDFYEYNFKIEAIDVLPMKYEKQFEIYTDILRNKYKIKQIDKENIDFITISQSLVIGKKNTFDFAFYLLIFLECFSTKLIRNHLVLFKPEKIKGIGEFNKTKLKQISNILNSIANKPERIHLETEEDRERVTKIFYAIYLIFNLHFQKDKIIEVFEKQFDYLSEKLIEFKTLLDYLIIPKDIVIKLIDNAKEYKYILNYLSFLGKDCLLFLQVINKKKEVILKLFEKAKNEEINKNEKDIDKDNDKNKEKEKEKIELIEIEKYIEPKKEDDMNLILQEINKLNLKEHIYLKFSTSFIEKYIDIYNEINLEYLILLKFIIDNITKFDTTFKLTYDMDKIIHDNGLIFVQKGKLKNIQLLDFIYQDEYYQNEIFNKKINRSLDILDGIDISLLNDENKKKFFEKWKMLDFVKIFESQLNEFIEKIGSLINEMKDFGLLFILYNIDLESKTQSKTQFIYKMQKKYNELIQTYKIENYQDFIEQTIKLIYISDVKNASIERFLREVINQKFDVKNVNEIYIKLINKYPKISTICKNEIINFFTKNKQNTNYSNILNFIKKCPNIRNDIFLHIDTFIIREDDFFNPEETERYSLFRALINNKILTKTQEKGFNYRTQTLENVALLQNKFKELNIRYKTIIIFFQDEKNNKMIEEIKDRINYLFLKNDEEANKIFQKLKSNIEQIKKEKNKLEVVLKYLSDFLYDSRKEDIEKLKRIIEDLKNDEIKLYETKKKEYNSYLNFYDKANEMKKKQRSIFFNQIHKLLKKTGKDDKEILEKIGFCFPKFKCIFDKDGIKKINLKELLYCLRPFQKKDKNDLIKELSILREIFGINTSKKYDEIQNSLLLILKREYIYNIAISILIFNSIIKPNLTQFNKDIEFIYRKLSDKIDINNIEKSKEYLNKYNINVDNEKENEFLDILIDMKENPAAILYLFDTTINNCFYLQELASHNDNSYITVNDILGLQKCIEFFHKLGSKDELKEKNDIDIINLLKINTENQKDIIIYIKNYLINYEQIKMLNSSLNQSEVLKYKIESLFNGAYFNLSNKKNKIMNCSYLDIERKKISLTREELKSLRERAQLSRNNNNIEYKIFIEKATEIINITNILEEIILKGYPKQITINIRLKISFDKQILKYDNSEYISFFNGKEESNYKKIIEQLKNLLLIVKTKQTLAYKKKPLIRYIYGPQFNYFYNFFKKNIKNINPFLKYVTNDSIKKQIDDFTIEKNGDIIDNNINDCNNYLSEILKINNLSYKEIYENAIISQINKNGKYQGIYIYLCEHLEKNIFQIYKYLTGNNPIAQNVLICNKDKTNEEITAFLYRAIYCEFNSCFIVAGIELLNNDQKIYIIDLLNHFFPRGDEKINSCLIFLYTTKTSDIYKNLETKKYIEILDIPKNLFELIKYEGNDIEIIKSDKSGVGKSTQIKKDIEKAGKKCICFPFGGVITRENTIQRLTKLEIDNDCVLYLDLYNTEQINLMMEFLFSILITRFYGQNEDIFYLSKEIEIKVEIPNTFIDFFEKFSVLTLFEVKELEINNIPPLIVPKQLDSNIQIVANYLKALKDNKINEFDLIIPKITPDGFEEHFYNIDNQKYKTSMNAEILSDEECQKLIFDSLKEIIPEPNYYQITSFINLLSIQLKRLNQSYFINAHQLKISKKNCTIRTFIVENFIKFAKNLAKGVFSNILNNKENIHKKQFGLYDENNDINNAINILAKYEHQKISFDNLDPSLIFFLEGESFNIITNKNKEDIEYSLLLLLKNAQSFYSKDFIKELPNYKQYSQIQFLKELKEILNINNPVKRTETSDKKSLEEIAGNYVFTADNFIKMILILLRIKANIPVIMMGETGCGKTALIRKLSELKNNGSSEKMKILNIHAGTNDKDIVDFIKEIVIPESNKIIEYEKFEKENAKINGFLFEETKIWVFLDEINTCKSMGLISELICKHTCQGEPLPSNIVFIAACNPYRQRETKGEIKDIKVGLDINLAQKGKEFLNQKELDDIQKSKKNNLVYNVNPLPHPLLNFVFNFGNLEPEVEEDYIRCIIKEAIQKVYYSSIGEKKGKKKEKQKDENNLIKLNKLASDLIIEAQKYIKEFNDKSSVSLREIRRFNIFYIFFYNYLNKRKQIIKNNNKIDDENNEFYLHLDEFSKQVYSINLSIFVCYYLRIIDKEKRNILTKKMNVIFQKFDERYQNQDFLELPLREEKFIVENIKLDKGIAKNRALLENIFSLFIAINTKVPIFIVGKPGCSKSLSVQLLIKTMQGDASENPFFKQFPKIIVCSYQGSLASTSKGVENIFLKSRSMYKKLKEEDKKNIIAMILFDEMGLAEHSPNNPLKVIHAELEYDQNEKYKKVAFVGISNWVLDAAKMNRGISISIPEPNEEDNIETALTIGKSYDEMIVENNKEIFENLGKSYYLYKSYLKEKHNLDGKEDFHGNRDFYHLIKIATRKIINLKEEEYTNNILINISIDSIERNFAGIIFENEKKTSLDIYKQRFKTIYPACQITTNYDVLTRVKESINDLNSRYLLLILNSSTSTFLLSSILSDIKKEYNIFIGSNFKDDFNNEEYALKVLNKVQVYMERPNILVLLNLDTVYPSMYDLFNQNFTIISNKNYARLAVGSNTNIFAYVNEQFKCIVNVDNDKIDKQEPPFLNRFEKQIISFDYLLNQELIQESEIIKSILYEMIIYDNEIYKGLNYNFEKLLINCNLDEIKAMAYQSSKEGIAKDKIVDYILSKISLTLPQDIIINMRINGFNAKYSEYFNKIIDYYGKEEHSNFVNFLEKIKSYKNVIYTFSNNLEHIKNINDINIPFIGEIINDENLKQININSIQSENELERQLEDFFNNDKSKICLIKFMPDEGNFMNYIKYFIENKEKNYETKKIFIFIVYMMRILNKDLNKKDTMTLEEQKQIEKKILHETLSNLSGYYQVFIDNLNGNAKFKLHEIIKKDSNEILKNCINLDEQLCLSLFKSISYMKYNIISQYKGINKNNYCNRLIKIISENENLKKYINDCLTKQIFNKNEDIINEIFKKENIINENDIDISSIIEKYLINIYSLKLNILFFLAEKDQFFSSFLSIKEENQNKNKENKTNENDKEKKGIENIAKLYFENLKLNDDRIRLIEKPRSNKIDILLGLKTPGIKPVLDRIIKIINDNNITKKFRSNENILRNYYVKEEITIELEKYINQFKRYNDYTIHLMNNEQLLLNIINENQDKNKGIYDLIMNDYYIIFINKNLKTKSKIKNDKEMKNNLIFDNFEENKNFLDYMVDLRKKIIIPYLKDNTIEKDILKQLAININWIESYKEEICSIMKMFLRLSNDIPDLFKEIKIIIEEKEIKYEISDRNPEYTRIVNEIFFLSIDSILRVITSKEEKYNLPNDKFFELININKEILQNALQLEANMNLRSKEVFSLQEILKLINAFYLNKLASVENIKKIIQYFSSQTTSNNEQYKRKITDNFNEFYTFLVKNLGNKRNKNFNFYKVLSFIFLNEYIKITFPDFRLLLLDKILENNDFLLNCSQIIKIIIENVFDSTPKVMINNLDLLEEEKSIIFKRINDTKNEFLDEIIINILERKIRAYFESITKLKDKKKLKELKELYPKYYNDNKTSNSQNETGIVFDNSLKIFKKTIDFLDLISTNNNICPNGHLCKLYSITFVKIYLSKVVLFIKEQYRKIGNIKDIMAVIQGIKNQNFGKVIKIYIFKLFYHYMNNNFELLKNYNYNANGIKFYNDFPSLFREQDEIMLNYFFLPLNFKDLENPSSETSETDDKYKNYLNQLYIFEEIRKNKFNKATKEMADLIKKNGLDTFIIISINKIISNLALTNYVIDKDEYQNFSSYIKSLFSSNYALTPELNKLLFLFYDEHNFKEKIRVKLAKENEIINQQLFEAILYGFRFCVNTIDSSNKNENSLYRLFFKEKGIELIKESLIPGIDGIENLHLFILQDIQEHFDKFEEDCGCYVCSCGFYHYILPDGFPSPNISFNCPNCNLPLGWDEKKKGMVLREGYYRIFKNEEQRDDQMKNERIRNEEISKLLLDDYIIKVNKIKNKSKLGFNKISNNYFKNQNKKIRKLSIIGYRLLNFINYIYLFFGYCSEYISEDNLNSCLIENMDIIKIIEINWNLLKELLENINIKSIQIFMNMIFTKLSTLINKCTLLKQEGDRESFEKEVESLIQKCIRNYSFFSTDYIKENMKLLELNNDDLKTIVTELIPITKYSEIEYPMFKYFLLTKYKTNEDLLNQMENKEKYPLLYQLLLNKSQIDKMKNLPSFNEFTNYMVENYSFRISRDDAKNKKLENEEICKNSKFNKKFTNFIKCWNEIKNDAKKYKNHPEMPVKNLSSRDPLIYFLNDNGEVGNGMYIASACQNFISWQNQFIQKIINSNICNGILNYYVNNIKRKIPLQNAKLGNILIIEEKFEQSNYIDLTDVIYSFSKRNIFNKDGTINYTNYNSFIYDFDAIEEELGKIILPGISQFENEDELNFVTFWSEGFRGGRSQIFMEFSLKYPQKPLTDTEKKNIFKYMKEQLPQNYDFKDFFGSIQMVFFYFTEVEMNKNDCIFENIIKEPPTYLKLSDDFKNFFSYRDYKLNELKIDKIMNIFLFIEHFCFKSIVETLNIIYKKGISEEIKTNIINKLLEKGNEKEDIITLEDLGAAVRRFISRYLTGNLESVNIKEDKELIEELCREDLWGDKIAKNDNLETIIKDKLKEFKLKVGQAYEFYELIGEEDKNLIKGYENEEEEEKEKKELKKEDINNKSLENENIEKKQINNKEEYNNKKKVLSLGDNIELNKNKKDNVMENVEKEKEEGVNEEVINQQHEEEKEKTINIEKGVETKKIEGINQEIKDQKNQVIKKEEENNNQPQLKEASKEVDKKQEDTNIQSNENKNNEEKEIEKQNNNEVNTNLNVLKVDKYQNIIEKKKELEKLEEINIDNKIEKSRDRKEQEKPKDKETNAINMENNTKIEKEKQEEELKQNENILEEIEKKNENKNN